MLHALLALNSLPKIGPIRVRRLLERFGDPETVLAQSSRTLQTVPNIGPEVASIISRWKELTDPETELALCEKNGISILTADSPLWPKLLSQSPDAPPLLYVKGEITPADQHAIGIVGSRRCTHYGRSCTRKFSQVLTSSGYTIISGLARGIDTEAHAAALDAKGRTIAVLGSGLLHLYPSENKDLAERIADGHGAVISEFPLRQPPDKQTFPQRNRIVANWSTALLVTESPARSGSLITAGLACEAGRTVFAIPGPIDRPQSQGCHDLIREGASLVTQPKEILQDLQELPLYFEQPTPPQKTQIKSEPEKPKPLITSELETQLLNELAEEAKTMDQLAITLNEPIHHISPALLGLEMKGFVTQIAGQRYTRNSI